MAAFFFELYFEDCHDVRKCFLYHVLLVNADCQEILTVKSICKGIFYIRRIVTIRVKEVKECTMWKLN